MAGVKVGNLDIQFGPAFDQAKGNQLVQSLQQVIGAVNTLASLITSASTPTGVGVHELADQTALGIDHTVTGLKSGQVLVAESATTAHFGFLTFGQIAGTDASTFASAANGDVIVLVNGFWSAAPISGVLGVANPGADSLLMWDVTVNAGAGGLAWAMDGTGIKITSGKVAVDDSQLVHGHLLGLMADDHPQYALVADTPQLGTLNTFTQLQVLEAGLTSGGDITLSGNLEQSGFEPEQRIQNTDDIPNEGTWRLHVEPGQEMWAAVNDDGSDAENWMYIQCIADVVDTIGFSATNFTFNGPSAVFAGTLTAAAFIGPGIAPGGVSGGGVTSVNIVSGSGSVNVSGGPITVSGIFNVDLPVMSGITPGAYTNCNLTVDAYGRITLIANGSGGGGSGTVTSVGLTVNATYIALGGTSSPITGSGTYTLDLSTAAKAALALGATSLQPVTGLGGSYTNANITLNASGQITAAANGTAGSGTVTSVGLTSTGATITVTGTSPITGAGTFNVELPNTAVTAGSYINASLTVDAHGRLTAAASGTTNITVDTHPSPELSVNDEFEEQGSAIDTTGGRFSGAASWTAFNIGTSSSTQNQGALLLSTTLSASRTYAGYTQAIAGATWSYTARVHQQAPNTNSLPGLFLATASGASGKVNAFGINSTGFVVQHLTNPTTFSANAFSGGSYAAISGTYPWVYLQIAFDGTNLHYNVSATGMPGSFTTLFSETPAAFLGTPTLIGVGNDNESASAQSVLVCDWFRKTL